MTSLNATPSTSTTLVEPRGESLVSSGPVQWVSRRIGRWEWMLHPAHSFLLEPAGPDWTSLENDARAMQVKTNDGRQVWRVQLDRGLVFAKVGRPARKWPRMRTRLFGSDAAKECRIAEYAATHGIDTIRPVARAEAPIDGRRPVSILITAGLPRSRPLSDVWSSLDPEQRTTRRTKNHIVDEVARMLAHAHQNGFEHHDLHSGNVLLDALPQGRFRPLFVDLHSVRVGRPVSDHGVIRNLAQFNQWFRLHAPLSDRVRFLERYLEWRNEYQSSAAFGRKLRCSPRDLLRRLDEAARSHASALYAKRDRRVLRSGRYFTRLSLKDGWRAHVYLEAKHPVPGSRASEMTMTTEQWRQWLSDPLKLVRPESRRDLLKDSATATVCRATLPHPEGALPVVCKRQLAKNRLKRLQGLFRRSRPMTTWHRANALLHRQILTARPLAVLEQRRCGVVVDSLLITEQVEHAIDLDTLLTVTMRDLPSERQRWLKQKLLDGLTAVIKQLIDRGFRHRDLKAPNIIVQWDPQGDQDPRIVLVDLDGVLPLRGNAEASKLKMAMRLNVSLDHCRRVTRTDRLRMLQRLLGRFAADRNEWKQIWRRLGGMSERKREIREKHQQRKFARYGRF